MHIYIYVAVNKTVADSDDGLSHVWHEANI